MAPFQPAVLGGLINFDVLTKALVWGLVVMLFAVLMLNRGNRTFINLSAQEDALLLGIGAVGLIYGLMATNMIAFAAGIAIVVAAAGSAFTNLYDLS